jgi:hypothetical protein
VRDDWQLYFPRNKQHHSKANAANTCKVTAETDDGIQARQVRVLLLIVATSKHGQNPGYAMFLVLGRMAEEEVCFYWKRITTTRTQIPRAYILQRSTGSSFETSSPNSSFLLKALKMEDRWSTGHAHLGRKNEHISFQKHRLKGRKYSAAISQRRCSLQKLSVAFYSKLHNIYSAICFICDTST